MKKILTFAFTALLLGGFVLNVDAQTPVRGKSKGKSAKVTLNKNKASTNISAPGLQGISKASTNNPDQMIKNYEDAVERCLVIFDAIQNKTESVKANPKEFNNALKEAETLRDNIDKMKADLNRSQTDRFNKATKKLSKVYK